MPPATHCNGCKKMFSDAGPNDESVSCKRRRTEDADQQTSIRSKSPRQAWSSHEFKWVNLPDRTESEEEQLSRPPIEIEIINLAGDSHTLRYHRDVSFEW